MNMKLLFCVLTAFSFLVVEHAECYSDGAGACESGMASVFGYHLDTSRPVKMHSLSGKKITVSFNSLAVAEDSTAQLVVGKTYVIEVMQKRGFKGVLIRVEDPMQIIVKLTPDMNTQAAVACESPVAGVTHMDSSLKTMASGLLRYDIPTKGVMFDINVVFANNETLSDYAYGQLYADFNCIKKAKKCKKSSHCCGALKCRDKICAT